MYSALLSLLAPAGARSRLSILIFHRVHAEADPMLPTEPDARAFDAILGSLKTCFNILPLDEAIARLASDSLPARPLCITFDDGYASNYRVAVPVLKKHGLSASFFLVSAYLNGGVMLNAAIVEAMRRCRDTELDLSTLGLGRHALGGIATRQQAADSLTDALKYLRPEEREHKVAAVASAAGVELPRDLMMSTEEVRGLRDA